MDGKYHGNAREEGSGGSSRSKERWSPLSHLSDSGKHAEKPVHNLEEIGRKEAREVADQAKSRPEMRISGEQSGNWETGHTSSRKDVAGQDFTEAIIEQIATLKPTLDSQLKKIPALRDFPVNEIWRLCIDGRYQDIPEGSISSLHDEPFFVPGVMRGLSAMFDGLKKETLTGEYLEYLHDKCIKSTFTIEDGNNVTASLGFLKKAKNEKEFNIGFELMEENFSEKGLEELKTKYACRKGGEQRDPRYGDKGHPVGNACHINPEVMWKTFQRHEVCDIAPEAAREIATSIFNQYYSEIDKSNGNKKKIAGAIVRCCQDLEQMHFFRDGNIRTIAFTVLPKMLLENGFTPTILHNPNIFDGMSTGEIQAAILEGQKSFKHLRANLQGNVVEKIPGKQSSQSS